MGGVRDCAVNLLIRCQAQFAFPFTSSGSLGHALAHGRAVGGRVQIFCTMHTWRTDLSCCFSTFLKFVFIFEFFFDFEKLFIRLARQRKARARARKEKKKKKKKRGEGDKRREKKR